MEGGLAGMRNYSWGGMALAYLYGELVDACLPGDRALGGSVTLLTKLQKGHGEGVTYRSLLDRIQFDDVCWRSYEEHKEIQPFEEVFWYSGWIMCGVRRVYRHLPERVLR
uniref:IMP dehydrogenase/GMP reductase, putative n=1 Tax=Medicago truncatula TaxID=3880 RepID=Q1SN12_MEDTR|nr:IMP dehydrogenase/GMP reductase, putative [Medicago truncatula]